MQPFILDVKIDRRAFRLFVSQEYADEAKEQYLVTYQQHRYLFECNRPVIKRHGLKHFPYTWKLLEGKFKHHSNQTELLKALEEALRKMK